MSPGVWPVLLTPLPSLLLSLSLFLLQRTVPVPASVSAVLRARWERERECALELLVPTQLFNVHGELNGMLNCMLNCADEQDTDLLRSFFLTSVPFVRIKMCSFCTHRTSANANVRDLLVPTQCSTS